MHIGGIRIGDTLVCCQCDHERIVEKDWVEAVCAKAFPNRVPPRIFETDLARFRCSSCRSKRLLKRSGKVDVAVQSQSTEAVPGFQLATAYLDQASVQEQLVLMRWAQQLVFIRMSNDPPLEKAKQAIQVTIDSGAILPFLKFFGSEIKRIGWDERGLPERLALSAAAGAALVFSGQGAGIAALGGAIGVPLWVVFGAGGAFAGVVIDEVKRRVSTLEKE